MYVAGEPWYNKTMANKKTGLKKFKVEVRRDAGEEVCFIEVEAKDKEEAEELAVARASEDEDIEWDYLDGKQEYAFDVEEVK